MSSENSRFSSIEDSTEDKKPDLEYTLGNLRLDDPVLREAWQGLELLLHDPNQPYSRQEVRQAKKELYQGFIGYQRRVQKWFNRFTTKMDMVLSSSRSKDLLKFFSAAVIGFTFGQQLPQSDAKAFINSNKDIATEVQRAVGRKTIQKITKHTRVRSLEGKYLAAADLAQAPSPRLEGMELFPIKAQAMEALISTFPQGMFGETARIIYVDQESDSDLSEFKLSGDGWSILAEANYVNHEVTLFKSSAEKETILEIIDTLAHEATHHNDWFHNPRLSAAERLELLGEVLQRLKSDERFKKNYVESISSSNIQEQNITKAGEYFAEIVAAYLTGDLSLPAEDRDLAERMVNIIDPTYSLDDALSQRDKIVKQILAGN